MNEDRARLEAFIKGDRKGAEALVMSYSGPLINHAMHMLNGNRAEAEDIVQDSFLKLWQNATKLLENDDKIYLKAWLFRVTTNAVFDIKRKPVMQDESELEFLPSDEPSVEKNMIKEERAKFAMQLISELPERQRAAVLMSHFEGMGNIEIGKVLNVSVEAVESLLSRARRIMKDRAERLMEATR